MHKADREHQVAPLCKPVDLELQLWAVWALIAWLSPLQSIETEHLARQLDPKSGTHQGVRVA